ncbi:Nucleolar protein 4 [Eufriesea mexicana]|uniref:Nucleolar protein 4 n=1 Tax=Eufriesea mexicana TaxID=516756 RepID=A0A310SGD5_9HYME|nr:Nucleolar protein 4 [Eufriesea mexicana]
MERDTHCAHGTDEDRKQTNGSESQDAEVLSVAGQLLSESRPAPGSGVPFEAVAEGTQAFQYIPRKQLSLTTNLQKLVIEALHPFFPDNHFTGVPRKSHSLVTIRCKVGCGVRIPPDQARKPRRRLLSPRGQRDIGLGEGQGSVEGFGRYGVRPKSTLNGAEGTVPPGRVYKKVAIVENFFDIIHAVHVDLEGRPGKHAGQKRTYRTITETYAFLPREAVTRFLLGCTECQRRPRTPSPTNLSNQSQSTTTTPLTTTTLTSTTTPLSPAGAALTTTSTTSVQSSPKLREGNHGGEGKPLYSYRHHKHQRGSAVTTTTTTTTTTTPTTEKTDKEKEEKYNPLSITNLLKKEPVTGGFLPSADSLPDSRRTPESDRASSKSSASSKRKRMLPEGRTPSPQPSQPLPRPWSPGLDPKNTPIDYSLPITTSYLKHQQRLLQQAEKNKAAAMKETEMEQKVTVLPTEEIDNVERDRYSPATGLIDTNLNLLATIQHLHCQVMLALTERLRPSMTMPSPLVLPSATNMLSNGLMLGSEVSVQTGENHT